MTEPLFTPFRAWLIRDEWAERVVAGAYDAKSPADRRAIVAGNPYSFFGVTRSREDLPEGEDLSDEELVQRGAATLTRLLDAGAFEAAPHAAFFAYRLDFGDDQQTGIVGALDLNGLGDGRVLTHENVRPERATLLGRHLEVVGATSAPIALTHDPDPRARAILAAATEGPTMVDHVVEGVRHRVWTLTERASAELETILADTTVYVTDGHHRSAAALAARDAHPDDPAFARTLAVLFPADELRVEAFHRRAPDVGHRTVEELMKALSTVGRVDRVDSVEAATPTAGGQVGVYCAGSWLRLQLDPLERPSPVASLDVERLRRDVIGHVLGIDELAPGSGVDYVPNPTGIAEVIARCDADGMLGLIVHPTDVHDLMAVAAAGELMPPKSSYFAPKPRSGVFLRVLGCGATRDLEPS